MEMGSSSFTDSGGSSSSPPNSSSESLNGLKFGQKIYFEDVGLGPLPKSGTAAPPRRGRGEGARPPRCQVEGCRVDLSDAKTYYSRHKVCGMHSKSPKVVVSGLEQRFCQQCSRFHQLSEFDQGKRSCRRRLAGHNERRRKPPPGSLMSSCYGRLSSSVYGNNGRVGGFVMDFSAYPRLTERDAWSTARLPDQASGNQVTATGKYLPHPWHSNSENLSSDLFLQGYSTGGTGIAGPGIPPGECFTGISDSSCALSLLSNQPWGSANRTSGLGMNNLMNPDVVPMSQLTAPHAAASANHFPNASWGFRGNEAGSSAHGMVPDLGLGQNQFSGELELSQQGRRHYMELEHPRPYDSTQQMHWSL